MHKAPSKSDLLFSLQKAGLNRQRGTSPSFFHLHTVVLIHHDRILPIWNHAQSKTARVCDVPSHFYLARFLLHITRASQVEGVRSKALQFQGQIPPNMADNFPLPTNPFQQARWTGAKPNETEQETQARIQQMKAALIESRRIDQQLQEGRKALERRKQAIKILLLGLFYRHLLCQLTDINRSIGIRESESQTVVPTRRRTAYSPHVSTLEFCLEK